MGKYKKKPITIEAVQWNGTMTEVKALVGDDLPTFGPPGQSGSLRVSTPEGDMECRLGDWLIKGIKGEFYPCKSDIFEATYDPVEN